MHLKSVLFILLFSILSYNISIAQTLKNKIVRNAAEFLLAIDNNTNIFIDADSIDVSSKKLQAIIKKDKLKFDPERINLDNGLGLYNFENLKISGKNSGTYFFVDNEIDEVLIFKNSNNITLENLRMHHKIPSGWCEGYVLSMIDVAEIIIDNCELNGSGMIGIYINSGKNIWVTNTKIYNNSAYAISLMDANGIYFNDVEIFRNNCRTLISANNNSFVQFNNCKITKNVVEEVLINNINDNDESKIEFSNCKFDGNVENKMEFSLAKNFTKSKFIVTKSDFLVTDDKENYTNSNDNPINVTHSSVDYLYSSSVSEHDLNTLKYNKVSDEEISNYCKLIYDYKNKAFSASNVSKEFQTVIQLLLWEDEKDTRNFKSLDKYYAFPMQRYWSNRNYSKSDLENVYLKSWEKLIVSKNIIKSIKQTGTNQYEVALAYIFVTHKSKKTQVVNSYIKFEFVNGKIKSVFPS